MPWIHSFLGFWYPLTKNKCAKVLELLDTKDSKSVVFKGMRVGVPPLVLKSQNLHHDFFYFLGTT